MCTDLHSQMIAVWGTKISKIENKQKECEAHAILIIAHIENTNIAIKDCPFIKQLI